MNKRQLLVIGMWIGVSGFLELLANPAIQATERLIIDQEKIGYVFRSELWEGKLDAKKQVALKLQLFKGNEYCLCVGAEKKSGQKIQGNLVDEQLKGVGEFLPVLEGWGFVIFVKPQKTGTYLLLIESDTLVKGQLPVAVGIGYKP
jgi:hypothetical protein